jgi:transcriptional regulator with XRE-family HTH domain
VTLDEQLIYRLVGEHIRVARQRFVPSMSQVQLAEKIGVSRASVVNIEAGRQRPPLHVLWQIAEALGTELTDLIPSHAEYAKHEEPAELDEQMVAQIEEAAEGDTTTRQLLTDFVSRARTQP